MSTEDDYHDTEHLVDTMPLPTLPVPDPPRVRQPPPHQVESTRRAILMPPRDLQSDAAMMLWQQQNRVNYPWIRDYEAYIRQVEHLGSESLEVSRARFANFAKNGLLSIDDVITGTYLLFGTRRDQAFFTSILGRPLAQ